MRAETTQNCISNDQAWKMTGEITFQNSKVVRSPHKVLPNFTSRCQRELDLLPQSITSPSKFATPISRACLLKAPAWDFYICRSQSSALSNFEILYKSWKLIILKLCNYEVGCIGQALCITTPSLQSSSAPVHSPTLAVSKVPMYTQEVWRSIDDIPQTSKSPCTRISCSSEARDSE